MNPRSIRFRLAAWYGIALALSLTAFGGLSWFALWHVLQHSASDILRERVESVRNFMQEQAGSMRIDEIRAEFKEHSVLGPGGDLFQVCDAQGAFLYRSAPLERGGLAIPLPGELPASGNEWLDQTVGGVELRLLARRVEVSGKAYTVQVALPMHETREGLAGFAIALLILIPAIVVLATAGGWWMARRALAPVDQIIHAAREIGEQSLASRLPVSATEDELQRLSQTLNQMLQRIESAFRRVADFTSDASHELRTPVALMRATAEVALRRPRTSEEYRQALHDVLDESVRTTGLIDSLLLLARADAGKASLERAPVDLTSLVQEAGVQGRKLAAERNLTFETADPADSTAMVNGDRPALRQLLLIVIDNAVKYTQQGTISLRLYGDEQAVGAQKQWHIDVRDTGAGIDSADLPHIFERFYRADKSRSRDSGGAGLGLSIARWIVESHGGSLVARSDGSGYGSTFTITIPGIS